MIYEFPSSNSNGCGGEESTLSVLLVENSNSCQTSLRHSLKRFSCSQVDTGEEALRLLRSDCFDCVLIDEFMIDESPLDLVCAVKKRWDSIPILMLCSAIDMSIAIQSVRHGATDFIIKELELGSLFDRITKHVGSAESHTEKCDETRYQVQAGVWNPGDMVVGRSRKMLEATRLARNAAAFPAPILILGESGTGKEVFARWIHKMSTRSEEPFVGVNLAAIPSDLVESTLFGHEKGAFTGATNSRIGKFGQAQGGTLLLDEITELRKDLQPKLLRVLQEGQFERVGGDRCIQGDIRIIAATNRDISELESGESLRTDLYYRLNVITIKLPPLRERLQDIPCFVELFLAKYNKMYNVNISAVSEQAMERFMGYHWPGNIRELENIIQRAVILSDKNVIRVSDLSDILRGEEADFVAQIADDEGTLEDLEKRYIAEMLKRADGHQGKTAKCLGIDRKTLYNKINKYDLCPSGNPNDTRRAGTA